jgi:hypothetical protein
MLGIFGLGDKPVYKLDLIAKVYFDVAKTRCRIFFARVEEQRANAANEKPRLPQEAAGGFEFGEFDVHDDPFGQSFAVRRILGIAAVIKRMPVEILRDG